MIGLGVFEGLVRGQESQLMASGAVGRSGKIPSSVFDQVSNGQNLIALQLNFCQGHARRRILCLIGIEYESDSLTIGRNVKLIGAGIAAWQFEVGTF